MKNTKRNQLRRAVRTPTEAAGLRERMETKLLRICADIGWICGWREERLGQVPAARRSSRKRVMLGRVLSAEAAAAQVDEAFRPVEAAFVSSGRVAYFHTESVAEGSGLADLGLDMQDELMRLSRMGASVGDVARILGDARVRSLGRTHWEQRQSML